MEKIVLWNGGLHKVVYTYSSSKEYDLINIDTGRRYNNINMSETSDFKPKSRDLGGYKIIYLEDKKSNKLTIRFGNYVYETTYFGDVDEYIDNNINSITGYFANKIDIEITNLILDVDKAFSNLIKGLKSTILPNTKDLLLAKIIENVKKNVGKVADEFNEKGIGSAIMNLFK